MLIDRHFRLLGATAKPSRRFDTTDTLLTKSKRILGNKKAPHAWSDYVILKLQNLSKLKA